MFFPIVFGITLCVISAMTSLVLHRVCGFVINYTGSLPRGIYRLRPIKKEINLGMIMIVTLAVPEHVQSIVYGRKWLFEGSMLMKLVAALSGDKISISENGLYINRRYFGPVFRYGEKQVFLASRYKKSFDSRYFGHLRVRDIVAQAIPVLTF